MRALLVVLVVVGAASPVEAADGEDSYRLRCASCHGGDGAGTDRAGSILTTLHRAGPDRLASIITEGVSSKGMPAIDIPLDELETLISYLKELAAAVAPAARDPRAPRPRPGTVEMADGTLLTSIILNESGFDTQLRTDHGGLHLLRRDGDTYRGRQYVAIASGLGFWAFALPSVP